MKVYDSVTWDLFMLDLTFKQDELYTIILQHLVSSVHMTILTLIIQITANTIATEKVH